MNIFSGESSRPTVTRSVNMLFQFTQTPSYFGRIDENDMNASDFPI